VTTDKDTDLNPEPADESDALALDTSKDVVSDAADSEVTDADTERADGEDTDADTAVAESEGIDAKVKPRRPRRVLTWVLSALLIASLAGSGFLGWQVWQQHRLNQASEKAQQAAVAYAQVLTSIDSNKVDDNFAQVLDGATGEFKDMYSQSSMQLRQLLIDNKATAHGVVLESAVQDATRNKAVVLLFVDQSVSNTNVPDPRLDRSRIKMTMEYVDGRWRASKVELP